MSFWARRALDSSVCTGPFIVNRDDCLPVGRSDHFLLADYLGARDIYSCLPTF
jgi:hypothetical protein